MSGLTDEDYWNPKTSQLPTFSFDEGDFTIDEARKRINACSLRKENTIISETIKNQSKFLVPIFEITSEKNLQKYLNYDKQKSPKLSKGNSKGVQDDVTKVEIDKKFNLSSCRSLKKKIDLLDEAISLLDGNYIILVVLHLVKTTKLALVTCILKTRPIALEHYMAHSITRLASNSIAELAEINEQHFIGLKLYSIQAKYFWDKEHLDLLKKKLQSIYNHWFDQLSYDNDSHIIKYYIDFIDWRLQAKTNIGINRASENNVNEYLKLYCKTFWDDADHQCNPYKLASMQAISNKQVEWIFLISKTNSQSWDDISKKFIKTNWFGNKKVINSLLNIEDIINYVGTKGGPTYLLEDLLNIMDDKTKSLSLAVKFKCHRHIINMHVQEKDRETLLNYKRKLIPQSEEYIYAENVLSSTNTKWKN